jgi:isopenicillin N synthase-like dioxygenase
MIRDFEGADDFDSVPMIDFAALAHDADTRAAFRFACTRVGFFYLANHGVEQSMIDDAMAQARRFFDQPEAAKMQVHLSRSSHACGYVPVYGENGDVHEAFDVVTEDATIDGERFAGDFRQPGNLWPEGDDALRRTLDLYSGRLRRLTRRLFSAFAEALDLSPDHFAPMTDRPISLLRLLHYPSQSPTDLDRAIGVRAHTDHECFTILSQDDVGGLQVRNHAGDWVEVPRTPGAFVVNIGDQLARWSNDRLASSLHRVINVSGRERYSIPFFVGANGDALIQALPGCVDDRHPAKYPPVRAGDYSLELIRRGYEAGTAV